jgi:SAM-dependent methyltransferase
MMHYSVKDITAFYTSTLGGIVSNEIDGIVRDFLPSSLKQQTILGIGYATPYLKSDLFENNTVMAFMSDSFGVQTWPRNEFSKVALIHDWLIPLPNQSVDYILLIHSVEFSTHLQSTFQEIWRVLKKDGKILMVVPNRLSLWSTFDTTPFGFGHPYTMGQALQLLSNNGFSSIKQKRILYSLPLESPLLRMVYKPIEILGPYLFKKFAGLNIVEAEKKTFSFSMHGTPEYVPSKKKQLAPLKI